MISPPFTNSDNRLLFASLFCLAFSFKSITIDNPFQIIRPKIVTDIRERMTVKEIKILVKLFLNPTVEVILIDDALFDVTFPQHRQFSSDRG